MDKHPDVDEAALVDAQYVQFSTEESTKYDLSKPCVLDRLQRQWKRKFGMSPVSYVNSEKSSIE